MIICFEPPSSDAESNDAAIETDEWRAETMDTSFADTCAPDGTVRRLLGMMLPVTILEVGGGGRL